MPFFRTCIFLVLINCGLDAGATVSAQTIFEKGYFIDTANQKTECYIKTEAWKANGEITYLLDLKDAKKTKPLNELLEVSVKDGFRIIRTKVKIDISGDTPTLYSYAEEPEWHEEEVFLLTLVAGKINLFVFEADGLKRFFYSREGLPVEQLVYKKYKTTTGFGTNDNFRKTLFEHVNCATNPVQYFNQLNYSADALIKHFTLENQCAGSNSVNYPIPLANSGIRTPHVNLDSLNATAVTPSNKQNAAPLPDKASTKVRYLGVEVNQLIRQIINLSSNNSPTTNPFAIQYASNSIETGRGISYGLTYGRNKFKDDSNGTLRETVDRTFTFRVGYERKRSISKRWTALHGYDFVIGGTKSKTENSFNGPPIIVETKGSNWGFGPRVGLMFSISEKVFLSTEATYYLRYFNDSQSITGQLDSKQKSSEFRLTLPITLFLSVKLGK